MEKGKRMKLFKKVEKEKVKGLYQDSKNAIRQHLWLELLFMVILALIVSSAVFLIVSHVIYSTDIGKRVFVSYEDSRDYVKKYMLEKMAQINEFTTEERDKDELESEIRSILSSDDFDSNYIDSSQNYLVDGTGKIMYQQGVVESLNLVKVIQNANNNEYSAERDKFIAIYPVIINNEVCYIYNESTLQPFSYGEFTDIGNILAFIAATAIFIVIIFRMTRDKIAYIEYLTSCLGEISKGNLDYKIEVVGSDELARVARSITHMEDELKYQIEAQIKTEKSKNELVTNVAHDLRTPLTSIIGYIGLVKTKCYKSEQEADKYLDIAYNKSEKLKVIIEDLFELTKLHQGNITLKKSEVSLSNLLNQLVEELMPLASDKGIEIESYIDSHQTSVYVDATKMSRVFENLIENAIKYCEANEVIYIELKSTPNTIYVVVSNPTKEVSEEEIEKFFERFYRADQSRNSAGGSGLGLAIAKNIVELHGGTIEAKLYQDLICFKVALPRKNVSI